MNSYVVVFAALIAVAAANVVRSTGGWGQAPPSLNVNLELAAGAALQGSGAGDANQQTQSYAIGDATNPAVLNQVQGINVAAVQNADIVEAAVADLTTGNTATVLEADGEQFVIATDVLGANISGGEAAGIANSAATDAVGEGSMSIAAVSINDVSNS